ncbi:MAG: S8 family serine peptidase, partial [Anaerolineales bacterium]|nr:S8 family serine peptidase [Anaerolineales bacterium]
NREGAQFHYTFDDLNSFVVTVPAQALKGLAKNPNVVSIEEDVPRYLIKSTAVEAAIETAAVWDNVTGYDGAEVLPWGAQAVQAPQAWDAATPATGAGVTVCIIDTGYYEDHEDLPASIGGMAQLDAPYTVDGYGHGSHVAGTIAALDNQIGVIGVSPDVSLYIVKFFGDDGAATAASDLIAASNDCAANDADIISMSLGGPRSSPFERRAFDAHYANGILSIAAAGNDGDSSNNYPASYSSVVSVAALNANEEWADFSQYNSSVEIAAPGVDVLSTIPYIDDTTVTVDGEVFSGIHVEFSRRGSASGTLVDGGLCTSAGAWGGAVVLCQRGDNSFADKILNVEAGGGVAALIYNNVSNEELYATMGAEYETIIGIGFSQETGQQLLAKLGRIAAVSSVYNFPASGYEAWQGTSMATPHVSAVAALLWSTNPSATNVEIREAINATAKDLGAAGRDVYYGYGLIQAYDALVYLGGGTPPVNTAPSVSITAPADGTSVEEGTSLTFTSSASDVEDGDLSASIVWTSNLDGGLGTGASVSAVLSVGTHTITASVEDSGGLTASDSITVTVTQGGTGGALVVTVDTDKDVYGDRQRVYIFVTVTDSSVPMSNANVTVTILTPKNGQKVYTGITDSNGVATISEYKTFVRKDGTGTYTVTAVATLSGYTEGTGSTTFFVQ